MTLSLFTFAVNLPAAKAHFYTSGVQIHPSVSTEQEFQRVWDDYYDGYLGVPDATCTYYQQAIFDDDLLVSCSLGGHCHVYLYKWVYCYWEGQWHDSGLMLARETVTGPYVPAGNYWVGPPDWTDDLGLNAGSTEWGLTWGWDFSECGFAGARWEVIYCVEVVSETMYHTYWDSDSYWYEALYHDETTGNEHNWQYAPSSDSEHAESVSWTNTYGTASVVNPTYGLEFADGAGCQLYAYSSGAVARVSYALAIDDGGNNHVHLKMKADYGSYMYVYISDDDTNWEELWSGYVSYGSYTWKDCGHPDTEFYEYVMIVSYRNTATSSIYIDSVYTGQNPD